MIRAYHFLGSDMCGDEEMLAGDVRRWHIGESRRYREVRIDAGENVFVTQRGYNSSPSLWSAFAHADGPVACRVEVSEPFRKIRTEFGRQQVSRKRRLVAARDLTTELRLFACDCASRILPLYERDYSSLAPRIAIKTARRFAEGDASPRELEAAMLSAREAACAISGTVYFAAWAATSTAFGDAIDAASSVLISAMLLGSDEVQWQHDHFVEKFKGVFS